MRIEENRMARKYNEIVMEKTRPRGNPWYRWIKGMKEGLEKRGEDKLEEKDGRREMGGEDSTLL